MKESLKNYLEEHIEECQRQEDNLRARREAFAVILQDLVDGRWDHAYAGDDPSDSGEEEQSLHAVEDETSYSWPGASNSV